jgi:DNA-binding CsgD family transcriptional regulator
MASVLFLQFLVLLAVGVGVLTVAYRWKVRNPRFAWFDDYYHYLVFFYISAFVFRFVPHIIEAILRNKAEFEKIYWILSNFLVLPLSLLYFLFFIRFSAGFVGRKIAVPVQRTYIALSTVAYLIMAAQSVGMLKGKLDGSFVQPFVIVNLAILIGLFLMPLWTAVRSRTTRDSSLERSAWTFATVHCCCLAAYEILVLTTRTDVGFFHQFFRFTLNLPPLIVLIRTTSLRAKMYPEPWEANLDGGLSLDRFRITARERDIIRLVCLGKSNAEIGKELFISIKTVKRHIYNIYQKAGVENRVQLVNLVRNTEIGGISPDA